MKISLTNRKLGAKIPSLNLPALITCREDVPCRKGCYACKGNYTYKNVKKSLEENLKDYQDNPERFFEEIIAYLKDDDIIFKRFRWFSSGDIVDYRFFKGIVKVAQKVKETRFLLYTKKFDIVNSYVALGHEIPENLQIIFSGWDKDFEIYNPYNFPETYVEFKDKTRNHEKIEKSILCNNDCKQCKACWYIRKGQSIKFIAH